MKEFLKKLRRLLNTIDLLGIRTLIEHINSEADSIKSQLKLTHIAFELLKQEAEDFQDKANIYKNQIVAIGDALPDMMWAKDLEGRYTYANRHIINNLLFSKSLDNTLYKTDIEHSMAEKSRVGNDNHTFGEVCGDSDTIVLEQKRPMKFLEYGLVKGKMIYLEVHKNVFRNAQGIIIGTVGAGRDVTHEYIALKDAIHNYELTPSEYRDILMNLLDTYKFTGLGDNNG
jgi:PAS domain-containing protein